LDGKFVELKSDLNEVEEFSKKNINSIVEKKLTDVDKAVSFFFQKLTDEHREKFVDYDSGITEVNSNLRSLEEKIAASNKTIYSKFTDSNKSVEERFNELTALRDQLDVYNKASTKENRELFEFIQEKLDTIDSKFITLTEEENRKYNDLLASVNNKDVVEYKTILKEKIQDVELTSIKEALQEDISKSLRGDITSLKRYVEMSSGGGSVAKQFAAGGTMDGNLTVVGDLSARTYLGIDIPPVNGLYLPLSGGNLTGTLSSNNTIIADTILATSLLSATNLDIGFELSGFNVTGSISANGNISSGSLTTPALSTDGIDAKFTDNVIIAGDLDIGFPNENEDQCITIHSSNSSGKRTQLIQTGGAFCIHPSIGNQCLILGSSSNHITMLCGNASHELRIPTGKVNIGTTGGTEKLTVAGNISASGNLAGANIVGNNVFSGGLAVCTSVPAQTIPTLQAVTDEGNSTTGSIGVGVTAPTSKLHVKNTSSGNVVRQIRLHNDSTSAGTGAGIAFTNSSSETFVGASIDSVRATSTANGNLVFSTRADTTGDDNAVIERMRINPTGEVSINTVPVDGIDLTTNTLSTLNLSANKITGGANSINTGARSFIGGGVNNKATGNCASVINGISLSATGNTSIAAGGYKNCASGGGTFVGSGRYNCATGNYSNIGSGYRNETLGSYSVVGGGFQNKAHCSMGVVGGGKANKALSGCSFVGGGGYNCANGNYAAIAGGKNNKASGSCSFVGGGTCNIATANTSSVVGGTGNVVSGYRSTVGGGYYNYATGNYSFVGGGTRSAACGNYSFVGSGQYKNEAKGNCSFVGTGLYGCACGTGSVIINGSFNCATGFKGTIANGYYIRAAGSYSFVGNGLRNCANGPSTFVGSGNYNCAIGNCSSIINGANNKASGSNSFIAGGVLNCVNVGHTCAFIIGTGITSNAACTTFVNNLSSQGIVNGCSITSYEGVKVGSGSIISCNASFTPSLSDNGRTLLLDTTSGSIVVTVTPQISGFTTRYIKEAGAAPVVFSTGTGLSGLYSYQDRNQMSIIYAQADIFFKSNNYAFLGGNLQ